MNRISKLLLVIAACALCAAPAAAQDGTLKKIKDTGVVKIGNRDASIPLSYLDDKQQPVGYGVDICMKVVDAIKAELKMPNLKVEFVPTYFMTGTRIIVKKSSRVKDYKDLKGKTVVFTSGTTNERAMKAYNDEHKLGINFIPSKDHAESFLAVETGRAAAFPMDDVILYGLRATAKKPGDFDVIGELLSDDPYGIMMRRDDPAFKKVVDTTVITLYKSGEINKIYKKWFESPIPPKQVNLKMPMSAALKELVKNPNDKGVEACGRMKC